MTLPAFRYHPNPLASGSVVPSDTACASCNEARGFIYVGPTYAEAELDDVLCPWCIHDGSAYAKFGVTFVDSEAFDGGTTDAVMRTIVERTPGFHAWQSERWLSCCSEPAAFLGAAGIEDIRERYPRLEGPLMTHIVHELGMSGGAARRILESLGRDEAPTAFVFQCLHCDHMPAYVDQT